MIFLCSYYYYKIHCYFKLIINYKLYSLKKMFTKNFLLIIALIIISNQTTCEIPNCINCE